jgi:tetratricopeptide (TPR) repeat protein
VREDLENYRGALAWLIERGRISEASAITSGLLIFWAIRGHAAEGLRWSEQLLNLPTLPPAAEARVLNTAGLMYYTQGNLGRARTALDRALALAHRVGDLAVVAQAENMLGHVENAAGNPHAARARFTRSVETFQAVAIPWGVGNALTGMAAAALAAGDAAQAERLIQEATSALRHGAPLFVSLALYVRATLAVRRGNADEALAVVRESLTHIRALHDKFAFVYALVPLAAAAVIKGDDEWAARILGARDAVTERTGATVADTAVHDLRDHSEHELRARLGPNQWARAYAAGRLTSIDTLIKDIDSALRGRARS